MSQPLPMAQKEYFEEVTHQGKTIKVGDKVLVNHAGQKQMVEVSSIFKKQQHYWVAYNHNQHVCPWPLAQVVK